MGSPVKKRQCTASSTKTNTAAAENADAAGEAKTDTGKNDSMSPTPEEPPKQKRLISQKDLLKPPPSILHPAEAARRAAAARAYAMQGVSAKPTKYAKQKRKKTAAAAATATAMSTNSRKRKSPLPISQTAQYYHSPTNPASPPPPWWHNKGAHPSQLQPSLYPMGKVPTAPVPTWKNQNASSNPPIKQMRYNWPDPTAKLDAALRPYLKKKSLTTTVGSNSPIPATALTKDSNTATSHPHPVPSNSQTPPNGKEASCIIDQQSAVSSPNTFKRKPQQAGQRHIANPRQNKYKQRHSPQSPRLSAHYHQYQHQHSNGSSSTITTNSHQSLIMSNLNQIDDEEYLKLLRSLGTDEPDTSFHDTKKKDNTNNVNTIGTGADGQPTGNSDNDVDNNDNPEEDDDDEEYQGEDPSSEEEDEEEGSIVQDNRRLPNPSSSTPQQTADTTMTPTATSQSSMAAKSIAGASMSASSPDAISLTPSEELDDHALENWDLFGDQDALEEELGSLFQEDLEATVNTLLNGRLDFGCGAGAGAGAGDKSGGASVADIPVVVANPDGVVNIVNCNNPDGGMDSVESTDCNGTASKAAILEISGDGVGANSTSTPSCTDVINPTTDLTTTASTPSKIHQGGSKLMSSTPPRINPSTVSTAFQASKMGSSPFIKSPASIATTATPTTINTTTTPASTNTTTPTSTHTTTPTSTIVTHGSVVQQPPPTEQQVLQLQRLMSQHYQIALQQAVLAVRFAHGNKCQKDHHYCVISNQKQRQQMQMQNKEQPITSSNSSDSGTIAPHKGKNTKIKQTTHPPLHQQEQQQREILLRRQKGNYYFGCGETSDDLAEIIDGAVTMLQDLDKNRKDGIRYRIQMHRTKADAASEAMRKHCGGPLEDKDGVRVMEDAFCGGGEGGRRRRRGRSECAGGLGLYPANAPSAARSILGAGGEDTNVKTMGHSTNKTDTVSGITGEDNDADMKNKDDGNVSGMLTRSAFSRTLQQQQNDWEVRVCDSDSDVDKHAETMLNQTNRSRLTSGSSGEVISKPSGGTGSSNSSHFNSVPHKNTIFGVKGLTRLNETFAAIDNSLSAKVGFGLSSGINILMESGHGRACELLLKHARADYDKNMIPGYIDLSNLMSYPSEVFGDGVAMTTMPFETEIQLRKCRGQFTSAEDNLLLRGVNLYGEKEWTLLSDRFLPDRSVSIIAQRYWRLCYLIYRANGVKIDEFGNLDSPPKHPNGVSDFDEAAIKATLKPVKPPALYNLYRWSLEEDITIMRSVPLMGRMFAEIAKRLIPHRNRGALRKRYQVLERRVKGSMKREKKSITGEKEKKKSVALMSKLVKNSQVGPTCTRGELTKKKKTLSNMTKQGATLPHPPNVYHGFGKQHTISPCISQTQKPPLTQASKGKHPSLSTQKLKSGLHTRLPATLPKLPPPSYKGLTPRGNGVMQKSYTAWQRAPSLVRSDLPPFLGSRGRGRHPPWIRPGRPPSISGPGKPSASLVAAKSAQISSVTDSPNQASSSGIMSSSNIVDNSSRLQVEEIIDGEWSQMSSIGNMIDREEGEVDKERANGENSDKGATSHGHNVEKLPDMEFDNSCSGLSMLNSVGRSQSQLDSDHGPSEGRRRRKHESIMSSVLGRAKEKQYQKASVPATATGKPPFKFDESENIILATKKQIKPTLSVTSEVDTTVDGKPSQFSMDGLNFSNFSLGDNTLLSPGLGSIRATSAMPTPTSTGYSKTFLNAPSTTGEFNMNSLMEPDFCAISALNQLSNSSVSFHKDTAGVDKQKSPDEKKDQPEKRGKAPKTSLYDRVMAKK